ncbi:MULTISPECIES: excalibur calcium-binding domain-containing protein [unclassified Sphingobium]|uniref:excalibur calcium-binding domain-containing protein n=1 Tax=unclassified Sphingobium TaxID=2611147 RepID=UPI002224F8FC|nr:MULTISPECIES: excalibur calcium-binding domain-containing protein [unclassified Sphingobium]
MDRSTGTRHCHRGLAGSAPLQSAHPARLTRSDNGTVYYPNCSAARAAGAAPVYRGQPGYGTHLDRDGDGKGCE